MICPYLQQKKDDRVFVKELNPHSVLPIRHQMARFPLFVLVHSSSAVRTMAERVRLPPISRDLSALCCCLYVVLRRRFHLASGDLKRDPRVSPSLCGSSLTLTIFSPLSQCHRLRKEATKTARRSVRTWSYCSSLSTRSSSS